MIHIDREQTQGLTDYKFFCFNGEPYCVQIDTGRYDGHRQNFYDMQWKSLGVHCSYPEGEGVRKPDGFEEMKLIAAQLSKDFPFVRVDLYNVGGKVYFGELTFYPSSGYGKFKPDNFDMVLGSQFKQTVNNEYGKIVSINDNDPSEWGGQFSGLQVLLLQRCA